VQLLSCSPACQINQQLQSLPSHSSAEHIHCVTCQQVLPLCHVASLHVRWVVCKTMLGRTMCQLARQDYIRKHSTFLPPAPSTKELINARQTAKNFISQRQPPDSGCCLTLATLLPWHAASSLQHTGPPPKILPLIFQTSTIRHACVQPQHSS